ncbi:nucleolar protein 16 [Kwoniella pini CBS 10737]|uniref:Nucleolar protein 16 n=1 Tax=Kwoniella pini CBS 10737 TaxID=1296096 RepID=A0A1B9I3J7_9TREE|nr:nucleolar protein 16 [Kwoniella pini CBS 10737]OCF50058.1 nucleolar protein 16 [Kwoniella pini CBS 10737]
MANPRQRSKAKSHKSTKPSIHRIRKLHQKQRRAPPLKGPEVLQQGWDKKKTVFQNYAALGLLPSIPIPNQSTSSRSQRVKLPIIPSTEKIEEQQPKVGFGRIIRDEEGNVIDIIIDEDEELEQEGNVPFAEDEGEKEPVEGKTEVVKQLEQLSSTAAPVTRHSSSSEKTWLSSLVQKYNDDYESMARDRKLNVWQKTQGEIKRMIKKAGGIEKLRNSA